MEKFSKLSLDDELDKTIKEEDIIRLSNLSISDEINGVPSQVFTRFMPHFPASPSPLRHAVQLNQFDPLGDKMEVDEDVDELVQDGDHVMIEEQKTQNVQSVTQIEEEGSQSPDQDLNSTSDLIAREEVSEPEESDLKEEEEEKKEKEEKTNKGGMIKALLSPTSLGVAAATRIDDSSIEPSVKTSNLSVKETHSPETTAIDFTNLKDELRWRSRTQPIHVSINHHHYYSGMDGQRPFVQEPWRSTESDYDSPYNSPPYKLPLPWSSNSNPVSKHAYTFASYLQLFLNFITVVVIFSFVTSLVRSLKTDITSTWDHKRLELEYESIGCKNLYVTNECILGNKPALHDKCQKWEQCMSRDNNVFFRARTTSGAHLFGEVINSFVEPIGWKALFVILLGLTMWCFSSNFLLGYMRAKSYYGDVAKQYLRRQRNRLFLKNDDGVNTEPS